MKRIRLIIIATLCLLPALRVLAQDDVLSVAAQAAKELAAAPEVEAPAPKPNYWDNSLVTNLNFIQTGYSAWAKGGNSNVTLATYIDGNANYKKDKIYWNNRLQLDYGLMYSSDKPITQKTKDRIQLESTVGREVNKWLSYTAKFIFLSQFTQGFTYNTPDEGTSKQAWKDARTLNSDFLAPADITLGIGLDMKVGNWLTVNFAPLTGGLTICADESLRYLNGMELKSKYKDVENEYIDGSSSLLSNGYIYRPVLVEFGCQVTADASLKINDNFSATTQLILFSDYLHNPQNIQVNWTNKFSWKLAKYFSLTLSTDLIYNDTVLIVTDDYPDGHKAVQFMESLQFGFTYTFASKK